MKVQVPYLSRIEGHAHLVVDTKAGEVVECQLEVVETPRFFEKLLVGRHYSEVAGLARDLALEPLDCVTDLAGIERCLLFGRRRARQKGSRE